MLSEQVLNRIGQLNRDQNAAPAVARLAAWRAQQRRSATDAAPKPRRAGEAQADAQSSAPASSSPLAERHEVARDRDAMRRLPEGREVETPLGKHLLIERPLHELWSGAEPWLARLARPCEAGGRPLSEQEGDESRAESPLHPELQRLLEGLPDTAMFLDLETCGFAGSMVFLAGLLVAGPEGVTLVQLLARHYGEERAMMHTLWQIAAHQTVLATFNGKSFDWPTVRDRTTLHRIEPQGPLAADSPPHCDLLHASRRRWRHELPNCRLQTLEWRVCGRRRSGDIPGRQIPDAYHHFVRSGDAWQIRQVLHHNALDLLTLLQLSLMLLTR